jgi:hypothetical protein
MLIATWQLSPGRCLSVITCEWEQVVKGCNVFGFQTTGSQMSKLSLSLSTLLLFLRLSFVYLFLLPCSFESELMVCFSAELCSDSSYPRLSQMLIEYEQPWKKLHEDFGPHTRVFLHFYCSSSAFTVSSITLKDSFSCCCFQILSL